VEGFWDLLMARIFKVSDPTHAIAFIYLWASLLFLALLLGSTGECGSPEQPRASAEPVPVAPGPLPPPQEQLLTPIPRQFDWMRREVRPNPFLESFLGLREAIPRLLMSISLIEEYSNNFFLAERDRQEEYRTSLNIGTVYRMDRGRSFVALANSIRGAYDALAGRGSFAFANLSLNAGYQLPRLSLALSESFIRSDEAEEATPAGVRRERRPFSQNVISPQIRYSLTPITALNLLYTNTLVWNENASQDNTDTSIVNQSSVEGDSVSHAFSGGLQHRITRDLSGGASYTYSMTNSDETPDTQSHAALADLAYIINPRTTASFRAFGTLIDRSQGTADVSTGETDARIFGASFGVRRQITSALRAFVSVGPTLVARERRPTRVFANWQTGLDGAVPLTQRTSLSLSTQQSIEDTAGDINDVGLVSSRSATLALNHAFSRDLLASLFANVTQTQTLEDIATDVSTENRDFTLWSTGVSLSYALTPIWSLSATYRYQHRDSDVQDGTVDGTRLGGKYSENRVIFYLSAAFPVF
jgi:opacity protein-like surface antigen